MLYYSAIDKWTPKCKSVVFKMCYYITHTSLLKINFEKEKEKAKKKVHKIDFALSFAKIE